MEKTYRSDHHDGKRFLNPVPTVVSQPGGMRRTLWDMITTRAERVPKIKPGPFKTDTSLFDVAPVSGLRITWIGHSSLLIEIDGKRILTDPVWSKRASPVSFVGPARFFDAPLLLKDLPPLDAIILSHDHYDHLDRAVITQLRHANTRFYCSLGVGQHLVKWGIANSRINEMDWWQTATLDTDFSITTTPARHFAGRGIFNRNSTLWSAFVIKGPRNNIYFGADSGMWPGFEDIGNKYGPFDLTMLEIGAYNENWADIHMGPDNAAEAHRMLKGKVMMPIHWGTFNLALHAWTEPVHRLQKAATEKNIKLFLPAPGAPTVVTEEGFSANWWH